jgi:hypothetical protein
MNNLNSELFKNNVITDESLDLIHGGETGADCDCGVEQATSTKDATEPSGGCGDIAIDGEIVRHIYG